MTDKKFTLEEIEQLRQNKYVLSVTENKISYSLELDFVLEKLEQLIKVHAVTFEADIMIHIDQGCHYTKMLEYR